MTLFCGIFDVWIKILVSRLDGAAASCLRHLFLTFFGSFPSRPALVLVLKRVFTRNHLKQKYVPPASLLSWNQTHFDVKRFCTKTHYEKDAKCNQFYGLMIARYSLVNNKLACTCRKITSFNQRKSCNGSGTVNKCCLKLLFAQICVETGKRRKHTNPSMLGRKIKIACYSGTSFLIAYHICLVLSTFYHFGEPMKQINWKFTIYNQLLLIWVTYIQDSEFTDMEVIYLFCQQDTN